MGQYTKNWKSLQYKTKSFDSVVEAFFFVPEEGDRTRRRFAPPQKPTVSEVSVRFTHGTVFLNGRK